MIKKIRQSLRLFFTQAWQGYQSRFAITNPFGYLTAKFGFPFFLMIFFLFLGKYIGNTDPAYIVIGNIILIPANGGICGLNLSIAEERQWGTLPYVLGSPAARLPIFFGRATFYILDGFITTLLGLAAAAWIFEINLSQVNFGLLTLCTILCAITSIGLGFLFGSISLITRDGWMIVTTFLGFLFILIGVNYPVDALPRFHQSVAYALPITRGLQAIRLVISGAGWQEISSLVTWEAIVGIIYIIFGYMCFLVIEKRSTITGTLDIV